MKRFLIALIVLVPSLASAQVSPYPLGVSAPIFGLPASGVSGGGTVTSPQLLLPDGTVALPALAFSSDPDTGWYWTSDGAILMSINGALTHQWGNTYYANSSNSACLQFGAAGDTTWCRSAAGAWITSASGTATTSTDGISIANSTAATVGTPVQISRRGRLTGFGWDVNDTVSRSVSFFTETLPVSGNTVTGTYKIGFIDPVSSAITYPMTLASGGSLTTLVDVNSPAIRGDIIYLDQGGNRTRIASSANALINIADNGGSVGIQFNTGTAAPTSGCTVTANSRNTTGQITATGATTCTITFGAPAWTNAPFCTITPNAAPTTVPYINGDPTTTAFVVAGMTAGDNLKFSYHCVGRI